MLPTLLPARRADLETFQSGEELTLFDSRSNHVHALNATSAAIWDRCDGTRDVATLAGELGLPVAVVELALSQFAACNLLQGHSSLPRITRRVAVQRLAAAGFIGALVLPAISSITQATNAGAISCAPNDAPCVLGVVPCCDPLALCFNLGAGEICARDS